MGGGKTSAVLTALDILHLAGSNFLPALVLAPLRVARDVWPYETAEWEHLKGFSIAPIIGTERERRYALHRKATIYTMNYENIPWLIEQCGDRWPFQTVIADEATRLKNYRVRKGGERSTALAKILRKTHRWVNLTGTPSPNGLKDLWGQNFFIDEGERLGRTYTDFKDRWFTYNPYSRALTPKEHAEKQIYDRLRDVTLSVDLRDYCDIKDPFVKPVYVDLPRAVMEKYKELEIELEVQLNKDEKLTALTAAALSTKCLQFAAGAAYHSPDKWAHIHDEKILALESIVAETAGAPLLVAYWWRHDAERILKAFPKARVLKTKKDEDDWNKGRIEMLLVHPQSAGHGLNLQHGGHHLIFLSMWWNLEYNQQVMERIGPVRQMQSGYDRMVYHYYIIARNTVDEQVMERNTEKAEVQTLLLNAMKRRHHAIH